ncbi:MULTISPECIES: adenylate kinase [Spiroplasma]|uniref:adenylate kinase n=1 Tax=Spiroplasma TaxID=2132 RepID=UPI00257617AC|nr:adenylate kinase [Spiroplasma ixodetis]WDA53666.1 MAG: adenylate kinase [Spiroplasma endosymbiont of Drosophila atripex]WJG69530.1 adenylate kinase [Spiroplasma ixodetis Y32]
MNLIILGPPGSGKGTQSQFLKEQYNLMHLSTGDLFRDEITKQSPVGKKAQTYVNKGQYVPDEITNEIISNTLKNIKHNFILDGYPRTISQVASLDKVLTSLNETLSMVLYLDINEETVIKRLSSRVTCPQCKAIYNLNFLPPKITGICDNDGVKLIKRIDDSDEKTIINRLKTYKVATAPLVDSYQERGLLRTVDANQDNSDIKKQIKSYLSSLKGNKNNG